MSSQVTVKRIAVDELPGGVPTLWHVGPDFITALFSRQATVDEIVTAMNAMYPVMAAGSIALRPVSAAA